MELRWIKYLIAGVILTGVIIFSALALYNVVVYKIPVFGPSASTALPELNTISRPVHFTDIATDDPVRENLLTEDQAWVSVWAFLHDRVGFTIFLPMEKKSGGLQKVIDEKGNQYQVWSFFITQHKRPFLLFTGMTLGGVIFIDAHDGHVLWYAAYL